MIKMITVEQLKDAFNQLQWYFEEDNGIAADNKTKEAYKLIVSIAIKEFPKEPVKDYDHPRYGMGDVYHDWICPTCGKYLTYEPNVKGIPKVCPLCRQRLKV